MIYVYRYLMIVLYTIFWGLIACLLGLVDRSGEGVIWVARNWVRWILATCHVEVACEGLDRIDPRQPYVFMSNHQSVIDTAAIVSTLPVSWRFVAKRELLFVPFFGWALGLGGHVIVDRGNHEKAMRSMKRAAERIRGGTNVIIFPEGTRSPSGVMGPFKSGGFHLAIEAGVPVLPITVSGTNQITPKGSLRIESGRVRILYGKPIPTADLDLESRGRLKDEVRQAISAGFDPTLQRGEPEASWQSDPIRG
ncbi:MAG TPA: lysophospholipid acyltransferase family protein [Myxococcota bacterium]|nr:lysophospholipid acyltransferase family protein [Myxococcota bacterium]